jgi:hypothetical protein
MCGYNADHIDWRACETKSSLGGRLKAGLFMLA